MSQDSNKKDNFFTIVGGGWRGVTPSYHECDISHIRGYRGHSLCLLLLIERHLLNNYLSRGFKSCLIGLFVGSGAFSESENRLKGLLEGCTLPYGFGKLEKFKREIRGPQLCATYFYKPLSNIPKEL